MKVGDLYKLVELQRVKMEEWWAGLEEVLTYDKESNSFIVELRERTGALVGFRNPNGCACWSVYLARLTDYKLRNRKA